MSETMTDDLCVRCRTRIYTGRSDHLCNECRVPSGPRERTTADLARIIVEAAQKTLQPGDIVDQDGDHQGPTIRGWESFHVDVLAALASRAPAGEQTEDVIELKAVLSALDLRKVQGYHRVTLDTIKSDVLALPVAAGAAPDGRAPSELRLAVLHLLSALDDRELGAVEVHVANAEVEAARRHLTRAVAEEPAHG